MLHVAHVHLMVPVLILCLLPAIDATPRPTGGEAGGSQPHRTVEVRIDLREATLPADELQVACDVLTCSLPDPHLCDELTTRLLALPFAWHRTGYSVELADGAEAPMRSDHRITGLVRAEQRHIIVFVHWADTVRDLDGAFRGIHRTLAHEIGHAMHQSCGDVTTLAAWRTARHLPPDVPLRGHATGLFRSVAEDFADAAMVWLTDGEFTARSLTERERFRPIRSVANGAVRADRPAPRRPLLPLLCRGRWRRSTDAVADGRGRTPACGARPPAGGDEGPLSRAAARRTVRVGL